MTRTVTVTIAAAVAAGIAAATTPLVPDLPAWVLAVLAAGILLAVGVASVAARGLATSPIAVVLGWLTVGGAPWTGWWDLAARTVLAGAVGGMVVALYGLPDLPDVVVGEVVDDASPT